ncbi:hypothetical protein DT351_10965 (plasmid) [Latilactobacillus curvatus]|uniref:DUF8208 domain-containing protein n=1 Tax=Latilactobacillus curvatus TaxID=28038 RepID=A0A385AGW4_LATCU|nr:hypothetical protein [Latilactobacillus curvatus]AXN36861.1 hypothetical protein DT351_10965 [Latilactobacillus curvatus]
MSDTEVMAVLEKFHNLLRTNNLFIDFFRYVMWWINYGLGMLLSGMNTVFFSMYKLLNIWDDPRVKEFIEPYMPVFWALGTCAVVWAGYKIMQQKKVDYAEKVNNGILAIVLFVGLSFFMTQISALVTASVSTVKATSNPVVEIYKGNLTDLMTIDKNGWRSDQEPQNSIKTMDDVRYIGADGITDVLSSGKLGFGKTKGLSDKGASIVDKQIKTINGERTVDKMTGVFVKNKYYYQYAWHPWFMLIQILTMFFVYALSSVKVAVLIFELNVLGLITQGVALTGIDKSDRNVKLLTKIRDTAAVLVLQAVLLSLYSIFIALSSSLIPTQWGKLFAQIGGAMFAVMGPNAIGEIFGIRSEVASVGGTLMGIGMGANALHRGASTAASLVKSTAGKVANGAMQTTAAVGGAMSGLTKKPSMPPIGDRIKEEIAKGKMPDLENELNGRTAGSDNQIPGTTGQQFGVQNGFDTSGADDTPIDQQTGISGVSHIGTDGAPNLGNGTGAPATTAAAMKTINSNPPKPALTGFSSPNSVTGEMTKRHIASTALKQSGLMGMGNTGVGTIGSDGENTSAPEINAAIGGQPTMPAGNIASSGGAIPGYGGGHVGVAAGGQAQQQMSVNQGTIPLLATSARQIMNLDVQQGAQKELVQATTGTASQAALGAYSNLVGRIQATPTVESAKRTYSIAQQTTSHLLKGK